MTLSPGTGVGPYEVAAPLGAGGPAFVRDLVDVRELRRGLAEAKERTRRLARPLAPIESSKSLAKAEWAKCIARDTKLGREVALKVLPDSFASDPDRLARFEREARVLASVNHPHIAQVYGFEQAAGIHVLVMELVEGEDLSRRIARGRIPLGEALPIARQIAEAIEAAHEQGIFIAISSPRTSRCGPMARSRCWTSGSPRRLAPLKRCPTTAKM